MSRICFALENNTDAFDIIQRARNEERMISQLLSERLRTALRDLVKLATLRARGEVEVESRFHDRTKELEQEYAKAQAGVEISFTAAQDRTECDYEEARQKITDRYTTEHRSASEEYARIKHKSNYLYTQAREKTESDFREARWTITTVYDSDKKVIKDQFEKARSHVENVSSKVDILQKEAYELLIHWNLGGGGVPVTLGNPTLGTEDPFGALDTCLASATSSVNQLKGLTTPKYATGLMLPVMCLLGWVLVSVPAFVIGIDLVWIVIWVAGTMLLAVLTWLGLRFWLSSQARVQVAKCLRPLAQAVADIQILRPRCLDKATSTNRQQRITSKKQHQEMLRRAVKKTRTQLREFARQRDRELAHAKKAYPPKLEELVTRRDTELQKLEETYRASQSENEQRHKRDTEQVRQKYERRRDESNRRHATDWTNLVTTWKQGTAQFRATAQELDRECRRLFPPWNDPSWESRQAPKAVPLGLRFGELQVSMERIPNGIPNDPHLPKLDLAGISFPALLPFPVRGSVSFRAFDEGRDEAVRTLQAILVRALTAIPPGKVRLTILDPVGRGENFAAFMHLADHDELLVTSRIWTEPAHIEQRLSDLTAHMENVLQKYLRNQFQSLEEYNAKAGEVAEAYRLLVVANFPVNFSPDAARRLVSLANSGARCGIHTLVTVDTKQPFPQGFDLADLEQACTLLIWENGRFLWNDRDFAPFPLTLDAPPDAEFTTRLMQVIGKEAKIASRVEVPFDSIAPAPPEWWTGQTARGISVPLGKAGATARQYLQLGEGTAQHALIAGKTGSGKSTLLHALITQLALQYSPDEVELYLIDFKKGVEFKTYAAHELPHARVVAVESEREFGLSVLQRLDVELKIRGERFRAKGVNDLPSFKESVTAASAAKNGPTPHCSALERMPRIMLIVDEFQEFFVEDDKIAQEAALLLDRLVRQGRAFGVHVLLGSQTLGGAYSLARSTIDQMAVRIALQCSEADAHLILSKDNGAARLLTRPGEAIYNAANGLLEGNNLFQIVWLSEDRRDKLLENIRTLARDRRFEPPHPQMVFEGMAPSDIRKNAPLQKLLLEPLETAPAIPTAWIGEPIAIKEATAATFRRQSGGNLLMVGQNDESAFSILLASLVSLSAQLPRPANGAVTPSLSFVVGAAIDGEAGQLLARLPDILPVKVVMPRDLPATIAGLAEEVERRLSDPTPASPLFLVLHGLQRLRDLRKSDDDFGFSRKEDKPSPAQQFLTILREGPVVGVHTLVWCDNFSNLQRTLDRQALREFEMRVLFQMSANDSSALIDSPLAAKLGHHRALYYTEDQGRLEKFRPYGLPTMAWLESLKLHAKGFVKQPS